MGKIFKVAIQGIEASFHEEAAFTFFGHDIDLLYCNTFRQTFMALQENRADCVVMAIENSIAGSLLTNYSLLHEFEFKIIGEVALKIELHLLALHGVAFEEIKYVQSHPIAIRQCVDFFDDYPHLEVIEKNDTSACAKQIKDEQLRDTVAIAGMAAAKRYGLNVLERRIETHKKNFTRFLILSKSADEMDGANKASLSFQVNDRIGSLAKVLDAFAAHQLNLTKIQSMPVIGKPSRYNFYADLVWDDIVNYKKAIPSIAKLTSHLTIMGEYKKNNPNDL